MDNHTPLKHTEDNDPNEYYEIGFTSGKKIKGISQTVYHSNRCQLASKKNFVPFTIVTEKQEPIVVECVSEANLRMAREQAELDRKIQEKMEKMRQAQLLSAQKKIDVRNCLNHLAEAKKEQFRINNELYAAKLTHMSIVKRLEQEKQKAQDEVKDMKQMMQRSEKEILQTNKVLFAAEKENLSIRNEAANLEAKIQATKAKIGVKQESVNKLILTETELIADYEDAKKKNDEGSDALNDQILQLAVLKMQINHYLRVGFETLKGDHSVKKKILEKNPNLWQKKNKVLYNEEILYYILIQLYPCWHRLLEQLSYHFIGYKQLLFQPNLKEADTLPNLEDYIFTNAMKKTVNKGKRFIVLYSPLEETYQELRRTLFSLKGINNGIIHIHDVQINKYEANEEFVVDYSFKGDPRVKAFELVRLQELTRESIVPYIPRGGDKTSVIKIEVPFCYEALADKLKMEEIYRMFEKQK